MKGNGCQSLPYRFPEGWIAWLQWAFLPATRWLAPKKQAVYLNELTCSEISHQSLQLWVTSPVCLPGDDFDLEAVLVSETAGGDLALQRT